MEHLAILSPKLKVIEKIISGEKTIETRWYINKTSPWGKIKTGELIYFKNAGQAVSLRARIAKVDQFTFYSPQEVLPLLLQHKYSLGFTSTAFTDLTWLDKKRYGIFVFIKNVQRIPPFRINKVGFGNACAWMVAPSIENLRIV